MDESYLVYEVDILSFGDAPSKTMIGDVDLNGKISVIDATDIQKYLVNLIDLSDKKLKVADCNGDNSVNIVDVNLYKNI